jgi:hypothetical protein
MPELCVMKNSRIQGLEFLLRTVFNFSLQKSSQNKNPLFSYVFKITSHCYNSKPLTYNCGKTSARKVLEVFMEKSFLVFFTLGAAK